MPMPRPERPSGIVIVLLVGAWSVSVTGQVVALLLDRTWVAPTGVNEIGAALAMWLVAVYRTRTSEDPALEEKDTPDDER